MYGQSYENHNHGIDMSEMCTNHRIHYINVTTALLLYDGILYRWWDTRFHGLLNIVKMSGQYVICRVNVPGLGYN